MVFGAAMTRNWVSTKCMHWPEINRWRWYSRVPTRWVLSNKISNCYVRIMWLQAKSLSGRYPSPPVAVAYFSHWVYSTELWTSIQAKTGEERTVRYPTSFTITMWRICVGMWPVFLTSGPTLTPVISNSEASITGVSENCVMNGWTAGWPPPMMMVSTGSICVWQMYTLWQQKQSMNWKVPQWRHNTWSLC
jgi:hypothetical protein